MNIRAPRQAASAASSLDGKVALITGSTGGVGLGIARALAAAGSAVMLNGFGKPEEIAETRLRMMSDFRVDVRHSPADLSNAASIAVMIATTLDTFGRLDILVNNAGIQHVAPLEQFPVAKWDAILAVTLSSVFHTTRLSLPVMRKNKYGRIINIASADGLAASPFKAAYVAAKHGIVGLTRVTALETADDSITCNAICTDGGPSAGSSAKPDKQPAVTEELAALSVFLASEASACVNGAAMPADGGWISR